MSDKGVFRVTNFAAGPSAIPLEVLEVAQNEFLNYKDSGMSVLELSHRSELFESILSEAETNLRGTLNIPDNYKVLFMQGGGTGEFAACYLNMMASDVIFNKQQSAPGGKQLKCAYFITGIWSKKAYEECSKIGGSPHAIVDAKKYYNGAGYFGLPPREEWDMPKPEETAFVYYCDNETIGGVEMEVDSIVPHIDPSIPIVCDMSSNILSRKFDVSKFGIIYAGAQKNIGPSGLTIVIIRDDLLSRNAPNNTSYIPSVLDYKYFVDQGPMPNTPPTFAIYMCGLVLKHINRIGGLSTLENNRNAKAKLIYDVLDAFPNCYNNPIDKRYRSKMNIVFTMKDKSLEQKLLKLATENHFVEIKGHRSVGGFRISVYNSITVEQALKFSELLVSFAKENSQ
ncbi:hypothetical protein BB560_003377 [Smittium megazygosporum]|uniref:phosphoserine transaminase n=1 Tax=Smittium megazygosporum TaxID=133381 RepID=A0A2T9ZC63_9FUNG|nr:hypothetical protein BB560_003377 [Smittium megazygosporum]